VATQAEGGACRWVLLSVSASSLVLTSIARRNARIVLQRGSMSPVSMAFTLAVSRLARVATSSSDRPQDSRIARSARPSSRRSVSGVFTVYLFTVYLTTSVVAI
jgi:hypothetical protein